MTDQEINEAVARKLGYREDIPASSPVGDLEGFLWIKGNDTSRHYRLHDYCHSIEAAWEIVEKIKVVNKVDLYSREEGLWTMRTWRFHPMDATQWESEATADTAPMAICRAFLKLDHKFAEA